MIKSKKYSLEERNILHDWDKYLEYKNEFDRESILYYDYYQRRNLMHITFKEIFGYLIKINKAGKITAYNSSSCGSPKENL